MKHSFPCTTVFSLVLRQILRDARGGALAGTHGQDHGGRADDRVTAGEHARLRRGARALVGHDQAARRHFQPRRGFRDQRVGLRARRNHQHVDVDDELAALDRRRAATAARVRLAQLHAHAFDAGHPALLVAQDARRVRQQLETDALLLGMVHFLGARRHLLAAAAVHPRPRCRSKSVRLTATTQRWLSASEEK